MINKPLGPLSLALRDDPVMRQHIERLLGYAIESRLSFPVLVQLVASAARATNPSVDYSEISAVIHNHITLNIAGGYLAAMRGANGGVYLAS